MKNNFSGTSAWAVLGIFTTSFAVGGSSAYAQATNNSMTTSVTMNTSNTFAQGEPIVLHYRVTNTGDKTLDMGISTDETRFLTQSLEDADGKITQGYCPIDANTTDDQTGLFNGGAIAAHSSLEGDLVVNQWFHSLAPGTYTLSVHTSISYSDADPVAHTVAYSKVAGFRQDREDFQFSLVISPANANRLQAMAQQLEQEIVRQPTLGSPARKLLLGELFSLPEAQALPSWEKLASASSLSSWMSYDVIDDLRHLKTAATADILSSMITKQSQNSGADPYVYSALTDAMAVTYRDGDLPLRQHIRTLYASAGRPLAEIVGLPGKARIGN